MINVLIADDQNFVRKTLESYLESESDLNIIGFAENGKAAIDQVESLRPDVVLMDIEMPVMDGLAATKTIVEKFTETKVLMLTIHDREQDIASAIKLGAKGYWLKNTTAKELADAIRYVHKGYFQLTLELVEKHFSKASMPNILLQEDLELTINKLNIVDTVLAKIEHKIGPIKELNPQKLNETIEDIVKQEVEQKITVVKELSPLKLNETIKNIVKQEMIIQKEREANFQFRLDRMKHQLNSLEKSTNFVVKLQFVFNLVLFITILIFGYFLFLN
ncbi:response regulator transcription factor [Pleurocapsa sp. PCC 7319]|uniref:response regulator n=1 Tax=Pleurocapsa sp. PCC 7319 TaxID=118161 RepID=UPI00034B7CDE|nr:response regulator [Pleurocapsa sp. PCC 7319]